MDPWSSTDRHKHTDSPDVVCTLWNSRELRNFKVSLICSGSMRPATEFGSITEPDTLMPLKLFFSLKKCANIFYRIRLHQNLISRREHFAGTFSMINKGIIPSVGHLWPLAPAAAVMIFLLIFPYLYSWNIYGNLELVKKNVSCSKKLQYVKNLD